MRLYHTVQTLVKGPGGEIAGPVMVFTVSIGKEIATKNRVVWGSGALGHSVRLVHSAEVVCESAKLSLGEQPHKCHKTRVLLKHKKGQSLHSSYIASSEANGSCDRFFSDCMFKNHCMIHYHNKGCIHSYLRDTLC